MNNNTFPTPKEKEILNVIIHYIEKYQYPPSIREIGDMVGLKSTSTVHQHLGKMNEKGLIETEGFSIPRAIRVPGYAFVKVS
ncbi:MAG: hypothetical protein NC311_15120 [Muribaculaceae bacterium]|nr:hypothetical protein [Muribaculaceae bacterium]MCM1400350.1 hypothetical protein [Clostridium sp.]MCM1461053.1 hypothetical protein [Bacteroides sp.]